MTINYNRLTELMNVTMLRVELMTVLLKALVKPMQRMKQCVERYHNRAEYDITHTGQTCYLRGMLNDEIDAYSRRIRVEDITITDYYMMKRDDEPVDSRMGRTTRMVSDKGSPDVQASFKVVLPLVLWGTDMTMFYRVRALVDTYKLTGQRYMVTDQ